MPLPLLAAGIGLGLVSGAMNITGAIKQGKAAKKAADYNASILENNAILERERTTEMVRRTRIQGEKALGGIRANVGASGVTLSGSAMDVLAESAANVELDAFTFQKEGEARASQFMQEAKLVRAGGQTAMSNAKMSAIGSGLSTASMILGKF